MSRPPLSPHHSSTIQSLKARDARQPELLVVSVEEHLAGEAREIGEAQGALDVVHVHVGEPRRRVVAPRAHLGERDRSQAQRLGWEARGGHHHRDPADEILVDPPVGVGTVGAAHVVDAAANTLDGLRRGALHAGPTVAVLRREPCLPQMWWLDHVVVGGDHPGQRMLTHGDPPLQESWGYPCEPIPEVSERTTLTASPRPLMRVTSVAPSVRYRGGVRAVPTPPGVPVEITSPGSRVMMLEM